MTDKFETVKGPIGVFDSGYGGLTILEGIRKAMPDMDYLYLGDNARAPYGTRSFDVVYEFTRQAVHRLFSLGCPLVILACNTASAKALRTIQQKDLPGWDPSRRVLGIIRPTVETIGEYTRNGHIGIMATAGTVKSCSYPLEIEKLCPGIQVTQQACPMWVPLVENGEAEAEGADYFVRKYIDELLEKDPEIDTVVLGCTHFPLLKDKIRQYMPKGIRIITQGGIIADSLKDYLSRHPEINERITREGGIRYLTTESIGAFHSSASRFLMNENLDVNHIELTNP